MCENEHENCRQKLAADQEPSFLEQEDWHSTMRAKENALEKIDQEGQQFGNLEIQIAVVFLAFSALGSIVSDGNDLEKIVLIVSWVLLLVSLFLGLLTSHLKQKFRDRDCDKWEISMKIQKMVVEKEITSKAGKDLRKFISGYFPLRSPDWSWYLQTVILILGVASLLVAVTLIII